MRGVGHVYGQTTGVELGLLFERLMMMCGREQAQRRGLRAVCGGNPAMRETKLVKAHPRLDRDPT
jgi:hypothetical protein